MREEHLFQHFSAEEQIFVEKIMDLCKKVERSYAYQLTSFLNPRQEKIVLSLAAYYGLTVYSTADFLEAEFHRVIVAPDYYVLDRADFEIGLAELSYPVKFHRLTHPQILGTLLNQLGIRREYLGDIVNQNEQWFILMDRKFLDLAVRSIQQIGRVPVKWKEGDFATLNRVVSHMQETTVLLLSSLRLDKVLASAFKLSRSQSVKLIEASKVKVDYLESKQVGKPVEVGQLISVRGFGRLMIKDVLGYSKQGKIKVEIDIIKK